jgi:hypothetical protein
VQTDVEDELAEEHYVGEELLIEVMKGWQDSILRNA